ncbi:DNA-binding protein [Flavobacterium sp. SOK18b]|uniref:DNA-binding protein n=4 Tax=Flavobacteriaceae TaxID=49546 RepID=A0A4R5APW3_9FLAO|nr:DNA-binding protein [Flavobacterium sp. SOK18b]MBC5841753.1 helix-turn-helix domain-containing protein [Flavobacterium kayseriense]MBC5864361.1 helix-turn-helix domain-containing protein [Flavobacterium turcicum]NGY37641.1 helix-turn-helix domain-containing protein [Flavobacterium sp. XN-5]TDD73860.1 DNA-binding protein [Flavobacterium caseinilyticum]
MGHKISHIMSSNIEVIRICEHCKKQFTARTTRTRYCSHICNSRGYKSLVRKGKVEKSNNEIVQLLNTDLEKIKPLEFLKITQATLLFGISRSTLYRLVNNGQLDIAKFGKRTVIRRCDLEAFFAIPIQDVTLKTGQQFPGFDNCYTITEIQQKYNISSGALYLLIQRQGIVKYSVGKFTCVSKQDIDIIFNAAGR